MSHQNPVSETEAQAACVRVRIRFGSFWTLNGAVEVYTKPEAEESIREFIADCAEAGMDYTYKDVEVSISNAACVPATEVFPELLAA